MTPTAAFFFLLYRFVLVVGVIFWCERVYPGGGGGGLNPYVCLIDKCAAPKGMVFALFWSENGCRLCLFLSNSVLVFEGIRECLEVFVVSTLNE